MSSWYHPILPDVLRRGLSWDITVLSRPSLPFQPDSSQVKFHRSRRTPFQLPASLFSLPWDTATLPVPRLYFCYYTMRFSFLQEEKPG